jgi:hypothetical protein
VRRPIRPYRDASYNVAMTTTTIPVVRPMRRSVATFLAGVVLATGAAVAVNAAVGDDSSSPVSPIVHAAADTSCLVLRGPC